MDFMPSEFEDITKLENVYIGERSIMSIASASTGWFSPDSSLDVTLPNVTGYTRVGAICIPDTAQFVGITPYNRSGTKWSCNFYCRNAITDKHIYFYPIYLKN